MMEQADKDGTNSLDIIEFLQESTFSRYHASSSQRITDTDITIEISAVDEREAQGAGEGGRDRRRIFCL